MKYPFPKLLSNADKTHEHRDLKSLVLNVTDNTESMLTADFSFDKLSSKNKTKLKPKEEQESERTKLSSSLPLLNASSGSFTDINRMIESSSVETLYERVSVINFSTTARWDWVKMSETFTLKIITCSFTP